MEYKEFTYPEPAGLQEERIGEKMIVNVGPSHPATHGVLRLKLELDGDLIVRADPIVGQLHRGQEKIAENMTYNQFIPFTDRLDYLAPLCNNIAFAQCVEKLANIEITERCKTIRIICCELSRIASHLVGLAAYAMDAGSWTGFMYCFTQREKILTLFEELTGARMTSSYARIGGLARDIPEGWLGRVNSFANQFLPKLDEIDNLITRNRIFVDRAVGIGVVSKEMAMQWGLTGANLRASGVASDIRKDVPYLGYEDYDFDVVIGVNGDSYDRWMVRIEEMRQSIRIVRQAIEKMPEGAVSVANPKITLPQKDGVQRNMEDLINNFLVITQGPDIPEGEAYFEADNPKGALGFYIMSKGGGVPYRVKIRAPSFVSLSAMQEILPGHHFSDIAVILGSFDFVLGECDR
ncbi:MAG: NADH dehydrogenase (quinone) subunit D [Verrucomicrobiaceae bacterium]|nr:NADH dehydrogenase (quinone) subunit D [Verrucomicrobiaceae bacterium]